MKKIHEFKINKVEVVEVADTTTNENNEKITVTRKENKEIPHTFFLRRPNRVMNDDANLFFGVKVSEGVKAGLLTIPQLDKRNENDGGVFSENDRKRFDELLVKGQELETKLQSLSKNKNLSEEEQTEKRKVNDELSNIRLELNRLQSFHDSAYDHTAEVRARNLTITWWLLNLAYEEKDGKAIPFFGEGSYEQKLAKYDEFAEKEDEFLNKTIIKFLAFVSLWFNNRNLTTEDFNRFEELMNKNDEQLENEGKNANGETSKE